MKCIPFTQFHRTTTLYTTTYNQNIWYNIHACELLMDNASIIDKNTELEMNDDSLPSLYLIEVQLRSFNL